MPVFKNGKIRFLRHPSTIFLIFSPEKFVLLPLFLSSSRLKTESMAFRNTLFAAFFLFTVSTALAAGGVSGKVTDTNGAPLAYATIFVKEAGSGTTTNEEGNYEIQLKPGTYTLIFQFLGYQTEAREMRVGQRM